MRSAWAADGREGCRSGRPPALGFLLLLCLCRFDFVLRFLIRDVSIQTSMWCALSRACSGKGKGKGGAEGSEKKKPAAAAAEGAAATTPAAEGAGAAAAAAAPAAGAAAAAAEEPKAEQAAGEDKA